MQPTKHIMLPTYNPQRFSSQRASDLHYLEQAADQEFETLRSSYSDSEAQERADRWFHAAWERIQRDGSI